MQGKYIFAIHETIHLQQDAAIYLEDVLSKLLANLDWHTVHVPLTAAQTRWKESFQRVLEECKHLPYRFLPEPLDMTMADWKFQMQGSNFLKMTF